MKTKAIKIDEKNWKQLVQLKLDLGYKSMDELIEKMLVTFKSFYEKVGKKK